MSWTFTGGRQDGATASVAAIARDFWAGTGLADVFPRPIERAVALRLPVTVVKVPAVSVVAARRWLRERDLTAPLPDDDDRRDLMGCLVGHGGQGILFVCGADPADEQRLTVAHEAAHFLADYLPARRRAIGVLGPTITAVLDGERPATVAERAAAILAHVRLGPHVHLLPRNGSSGDGNGADLLVSPLNGRTAGPLPVVARRTTGSRNDRPASATESDARVEAVEARADALALELVAPRERVIGLLSQFGHPAGADPTAAAEELSRAFGLPPAAFAPLLRAAARPRGSPLLAAARLTSASSVEPSLSTSPRAAPARRPRPESEFTP